MLTLFLLLYVYGGDNYLVNLKVVRKTTKCHDFTVIFPLFQKCTVILPIFTVIFLQPQIYTQSDSPGAALSVGVNRTSLHAARPLCPDTVEKIQRVSPSVRPSVCSVRHTIRYEMLFLRDMKRNVILKATRQGQH